MLQRVFCQLAKASLKRYKWTLKKKNFFILLLMHDLMMDGLPWEQILISVALINNSDEFKSWIITLRWLGQNEHPMKSCQSYRMAHNLWNVILWTCFSERSRVNGKSWLIFLKAIHGDWYITKKEEFPSRFKIFLQSNF